MGELLGMRVRVGTGERLAQVAGQQVITLDTVKPLLDDLAAGPFRNWRRREAQGDGPHPAKRRAAGARTVILPRADDIRTKRD